jgi:hypothetical protein
MEWGFILLLVLVIPFIIMWPALIWMGAISGLYALIRDKVRRRATVSQKQPGEEVLGHKTTAH